MNTPRHAIRSYVLRTGRITRRRRARSRELLPRFGIAYSESCPRPSMPFFGRRAPRVLEIGFGNGDTLIELASKAPDTDFIGVEVHPPGIGHCLLAVEFLGLSNVRVIAHDAVEVLAQQLPPASLDEVLIYFPDPLAQEAPPQAAHRATGICRTRRRSPQARRQVPLGDGLGALRLAHARRAECSSRDSSNAAADGRVDRGSGCRAR